MTNITTRDYETGYKDGLRSAEASITALRAEVERLTGERDRQYDQNAEQITRLAALEAENEKLRAALRDAAEQMEWLAKKDPHCMGWVGPPWPSTTPAIKVAAEKARAALGGEAVTIIDERQKTHGDFYRVAGTAQELKDVLRRGKNWKVLDDTERETLEMIATKIGRILSGNPHEIDHWRDIAGYAALIERWLTSCTASGGDPTPHPGGCNPATPVPSPAASVWPLTPEEEEERVSRQR